MPPSSVIYVAVSRWGTLRYSFLLFVPSDVGSSGPGLALLPAIRENSMRYNFLATLAVAAAFTSFAHTQSANLAGIVPVNHGSNAVRTSGNQPPNILFIIMDDLGVDQLKIFGYGGATPPPTPNLE